VLSQYAEQRYAPGLLDGGAEGRGVPAQGAHIHDPGDAIFLRPGLRDEQEVSRRVTAVLMYLAEADARDA
jgi:hypothetical protein